jgi:hypothetical protein
MHILFLGFSVLLFVRSLSRLLIRLFLSTATNRVLVPRLRSKMKAFQSSPFFPHTWPFRLLTALLLTTSSPSGIGVILKLSRNIYFGYI